MANANAKPPQDATRVSGSTRRIVDLLKAERLRQGLSQQEVAERSGLTESSVSRLENNEDLNPTTKTLERLASALNVDFELKYKATNSRVVTVYNAAGGSGKTTFVREIGALLTQRGLKVLLIDMDPQSTLTYSLGVNVRSLTPGDTIIPAIWALQGGMATPEFKPLEVFGMDLIPAHGALSQLEVTLQNARYFALLERYIDSIRERYDVIFIDPTPFPGGLVSAAIRASDAIVVPLSGEAKSTWGYEEAHKFLEDLRTNKPSLRVAMFQPCQIDNTSLSSQTVEWAKAKLAPLAPLAPVLRYYPGVYRDSILQEKPLVHYGSPARTKGALDDLNAVTDMFLRVMEINVDA